MVFGKFAEIFSSAASRLSAPKSSNVGHLSPGLPPLPGSHRGVGYTSIGQKNNLRLSSSLQDFSAYRQLDLEDGDSAIDFQNNSTVSKQVNLLQKESGGSSFSKEKAAPGIGSTRKKWIRVSLVLLCLFLFACLVYVAQYLYFSWSQGTAKYYVVLDCGSTGTRVYVYQAYMNGKNDGSLPISLRSLPEGFQRKSGSQSGRAYNRMETEPGFDKLVHNKSGLRGAIKPLIHWAEKQIPAHAHKSTSLFMYATAGVRRLPSSDSEWLLDNAWSILKGSSFLCKREWVKVISGMEEAYFGWVALNYHTGVLGAMPRKQTFGALDLGGSSLQVTFESKDGIQDETSLKLSIGSVNHHLNAYSLSGYGLNDAFDKSVSHLLKKLTLAGDVNLLGENIKVKHPCLQSGYEEQYFCSHCASLYAEGGTPPTGQKKIENGGKPKVPIQLVGDPKWEECSTLAKVAVNLSEWSDQSSGIDCELQPCSLASNLPQPYGKFYAMSGFFVVYRFFNLTADAALDDVLEKGREFCEKTWDVAKISVAPQPFIEQYCFRAPYVVSLLRQGLHITDSQVVVGSGSITWTLGAALLEAGKSVSKGLELRSYEIFQLKINPIALFTVLAISLVVLLFALSCVSNWTPKVFRRQYLPLFRHNSASASSVLRFQRWSPIRSGDGRGKMPLSPTIGSGSQTPFDIGHGFSGNGVQLTESSMYPSSSSVLHSYSSGTLGQMQYDSSSTMSTFWSPHGGQMRLQSRRSQSREDLNSSLADAHLVKV
ncbi:OLC1v1005680C1 [Oldenlandia corymbosa var. corymbosa]|uniref:OLC1v1005680C1 n=1 Tax=Oldenlandia corymbosa var. corymbosa TaxID=529605 RepID=A0AAV1DF91_OLDCO|nr:OLC1v1005680C1 [Oldenlandia corymbosa var. corymbosa]